jgi:hypothetical protein
MSINLLRRQAPPLRKAELREALISLVWASYNSAFRRLGPRVTRPSEAFMFF